MPNSGELKGLSSPLGIRDGSGRCARLRRANRGSPAPVRADWSVSRRQYGCVTGLRQAACLFDEERHRIGLVDQSQPSGLGQIPGVARIHEDAAAHQDAMHVGDHRRHPAHVEVLAAHAGLAGQTFVDVALDRRFPEALVRSVDREVARCRRDLQIRVGEQEFADFAIEGETVRAVADGQHQHRRRAVQARSRQPPVCVPGCRKSLAVGDVAVVRAAQDREDAADRQIDVDIRRAVERFEDQQVLAARVLAGIW